MKKNIYIIAILSFFTLLFSSCDSFLQKQDNIYKKVKVIYETEIGEAPATRYYNVGEHIDVPYLVYPSYYFDHWSIKGSNEAIYDLQATKDIILVAHWVKQGDTQREELSIYPSGTENNPYELAYNRDDVIEIRDDYKGQIYYTLDGTKPDITNNEQLLTTKYLEVPKLEKFAVRAISVRDDGSVSNEAISYYYLPKISIIYDLNYTDATDTINNSSIIIHDYFTKDHLPEVKRDGYIFLGWFNSSGEQIKEGTEARYYSDVTLCAQWGKIINKIVPVKFSKTGCVAKGEKITLSCDTPGAKIYYGINPYSSAYYYIDTPYSENESIIINEDQKILAYASKGDYNSAISRADYFIPKYEVNFILSNEKESYCLKTVKDFYGTLISEFPTVPEQEGYNFLGWFDGEKIVTAPYEITSDTKLVTKYEPNDTVCEVLFSSMGEYRRGDKLALSCPTYGSEIYYKLPNDTYKLYTEPFVIPTDYYNSFSISAYAKKNGVYSEIIYQDFKLKDITITFDGNGVIPNPKSIITRSPGFYFTDESSYEGYHLPKIDKRKIPNNMTFLGWYNGNNKVENGKDYFDNDATLVAHWQKNGKVPNVLSNTNSEFDRGDKLYLTCPLEGAVIKYQYDAMSSPATYTKPINIYSTETYKVYAEKEGYEDSDITEITVIPKKYKFSLNLNGGYWGNPKNNLTELDPKYCYKNERVYYHQIPISKPNHTLIGFYDGDKIIATPDKNGWVTIDYNISKDVILTAIWKKNLPCNPVQASKAGEILNRERIYLSCPALPTFDVNGLQEEIIILYSLDGSEPTSTYDPNNGILFSYGYNTYEDYYNSPEAEHITLKAKAISKTNHMYFIDVREPSPVTTYTYVIKKHQVHVCFNGLKDSKGVPYKDITYYHYLNNNLYDWHKNDSFNNSNIEEGTTIEGWYCGNEKISRDTTVKSDMVIYPKFTTISSNK